MLAIRKPYRTIWNLKNQSAIPSRVHSLACSVHKVHELDASAEPRQMLPGPGRSQENRGVRAGGSGCKDGSGGCKALAGRGGCRA